MRVGAVHALGARGDRTAVPGLRTLLACGEPAVVEAAVDTLGILADPSAAAELVSLMRGDGEGLRRAAVGAVLRMADALIATDPALARILFERARHAARTEGHANAARAGLGRLDPER